MLLCARPSFVVRKSKVSPSYRTVPPPFVANHILRLLSSITSRTSSTRNPSFLEFREVFLEAYDVSFVPSYRTAPRDVASQRTPSREIKDAFTEASSMSLVMINSLSRYVLRASGKRKETFPYISFGCCHTASGAAREFSLSTIGLLGSASFQRINFPVTALKNHLVPDGISNVFVTLIR